MNNIVLIVSDHLATRAETRHCRLGRLSSMYMTSSGAYLAERIGVYKQGGRDGVGGPCAWLNRTLTNLYGEG